MSYEQQFLDALKDIFIGAKVEGASGYINLMKIKSRYFEQGVFPIMRSSPGQSCICHQTFLYLSGSGVGFGLSFSTRYVL